MRFDVKIDDELWKLFRRDDVFTDDAQALESVLLMILSQIDQKTPAEMQDLLQKSEKVKVRLR